MLRKGADLEVQDSNGKTVWDYINYTSKETSKETINKEKMEKLINASKKEKIEPEFRRAHYENKVFAEELVSTLNLMKIGEKKHIHNKIKKIIGNNIAPGKYLRDLKSSREFIHQQTPKTRDLALIEDIKQSNYKVVRLLLKSGVKANVMDINTDSALMLAVKENDKLFRRF